MYEIISVDVKKGAAVYWTLRLQDFIFGKVIPISNFTNELAKKATKPSKPIILDTKIDKF